MKNFQSSIVIGIMCFLLTAGIVIQISSLNNESTVFAKANKENELRDMVIDITQDYNKQYEKLEKKRKELEKLREKESKSDDQTQDWSKQLERINNCLGLSKVHGSFVYI